MTFAHNETVAGMGHTELRSDLAFFPLDDELVVFCEASQSLIGLNAAAAFIARALRNGAAPPELASALIAENGLAPQEAKDWVQATLDAFGSHGLLRNSKALLAAPASHATQEKLELERATMPSYQPFAAVAEGHYRLLGTYAVIRYAHLAQKRMVESIIGHLASDEDAASTLTIDIQCAMWTTDWHSVQMASNVYCNGKPEGRAIRLSSLGPLVKSVLWTIAVNAHDFVLDLHAGVVGKDGRCILLPAAPGSGKSSLTAALSNSGLGYYSDEVALVERGSFQVSPVPLAICVKSTGWALMSRYYPELLSLPTHRRGDDKQVRYVAPPATTVQKRPAQVSHIFFPRYSAEEPTQLIKLARSQALMRLMDQCLASRLRLETGEVRELVRWIGGIECYALTFSSLDEAVALVRATAFAGI
jgi:hypothetical protein